MQEEPALQAGTAAGQVADLGDPVAVHGLGEALGQQVLGIDIQVALLEKRAVCRCTHSDRRLGPLALPQAEQPRQQVGDGGAMLLGEAASDQVFQASATGPVVCFPPLQR